jgi:hypothetical protein
MAETTNANGNGKNGFGMIQNGLTIVLLMAALITPLYYQGQAQQDRVTEIGVVLMDLMKALHLDTVATAKHEGRVDEQLTAIRDRQDKNVDDILALDDRLQREMRDVNAVTDTKVQGLDLRLQSEIQTVSSLLQGIATRNVTQIDAGQRQQVESQVEIAKLAGRIDALESKP